MFILLNIAAFVIYMLLSNISGYLYKTVQYINREKKDGVRWVLPETKKEFKYHNISLIVLSAFRLVLLVGGYFYGLNPMMLVMALVMGRFSFMQGKHKARELCTNC